MSVLLMLASPITTSIAGDVLIDGAVVRRQGGATGCSSAIGSSVGDAWAGLAFLQFAPPAERHVHVQLVSHRQLGHGYAGLACRPGDLSPELLGIVRLPLAVACDIDAVRSSTHQKIVETTLECWGV